MIALMMRFTAPMNSECMLTRSRNALEPAATTGLSAPTPTAARRRHVGTQERCPTRPLLAQHFAVDSALKMMNANLLMEFNFEYWLHPSRYRTRACNAAGLFCQRQVCFFAHTPEQLRSQNKHTCPLVYRARMNGHENGILGFGSSSEDGASSCPMSGSPVAMIRMDGGSYFDGVSDFLINSLRNSKIPDENDHDQEIRGLDESSGISELDLELPHFDWISELVK
ncbi:hypothetical protein DKX38_000564 [Salix brachista]|uniref:C3H1-type domain-containing protein n=1 Tax=Salix brachista TaxID=2182728 RepID=A0A5N5P0T8_9ROSI|nr:hypothetical protein DKX38_000564 [Salix brachista]